MRVPLKKITDLVGFVARSEEVCLESVDIAVVTSAEMARMNRRYLRHRGATDVLSFDLTDSGDDGISAQIVVCGEWAVREARARDHGQQQELLLYIVHGLLHLMGYDDSSKRKASKMVSRQEELLYAFLEGQRH